MLETPQVTQTQPQGIAFIHLTVPRAEIRNVMGPGLAELRKAVADQGVTPAGPWFTHHLKLSPDLFDFEICLPIAAPFQPAGRAVPGELPAMKVVRTIYRGGYEGLPAAWREFDAWIAANGLIARSDLFECYLEGPDTQTELTRALVP